MELGRIEVANQGFGVLSGESIKERILSDRPLLIEYPDLDLQLQPNGFDLTLAQVSRFTSGGVLGVSNTDRVQADLELLTPDADGFFWLQTGAYHIAYNETVDLPRDLMALGRPRSSLNRSGVSIHTAVWDAGYRGRSTSLLQVVNENGWRVQMGSRVLQLVFITLATETAQGYAGIYQGENTRG